MLRSYSQNMSPRAKKFLVRSICLFDISSPSRARMLRLEIGMVKTVNDESDPSVSGLAA